MQWQHIRRSCTRSWRASSRCTSWRQPTAPQHVQQDAAADLHADTVLSALREDKAVKEVCRRCHCTWIAVGCSPQRFTPCVVAVLLRQQRLERPAAKQASNSRATQMRA